MKDLEIKRDGELMVAHVEAQTDEGTKFLDAYMPKDGTDYTVVDSGRLIVHSDGESGLLEAARENNLTWGHVA